jgi:hypothetical protein
VRAISLTYISLPVVKELEILLKVQISPGKEIGFYCYSMYHV